MTKIYQGSVGIQVTLETSYDVSTATALKIEVLRPDGTTAEWSAVASGGTALRYVTVATDLDQVGEYFLQAKVTIGTLVTRGETAKLVVSENFA